MVYVDLDELPRLVSDGILAGRRLSVAALLPEDHRALVASKERECEDDLHKSLRERVCHIVERETGEQVRGPVRLLTQLRYFGYYFSPLNLYYCFDESASHVQAVVAEVSNTPWREQHLYILHEGNRASASANEFSHAKTFHVSPFMDMDLQYRWEISAPAEQLHVNLSNVADGQQTPFFAADLALSRKPLTRANMTRMLVRYPLMTAQIMGAIYYQAFRLWWKACPYYPHPKTSSNLPHPQTAN